MEYDLKMMKTINGKSSHFHTFSSNLHVTVFRWPILHKCAHHTVIIYLMNQNQNEEKKIHTKNNSRKKNRMNNKLRCEGK